MNKLIAVMSSFFIFFSLLASSHKTVIVDKEKSIYHFGHLLTKEEQEQLICRHHTKSFCWPMPESPYNTVFFAFLKNHHIDYRIKEGHKEMVLKDIIPQIWSRFPEHWFLPKTVKQLLVWELFYNYAVPIESHHSPLANILDHYEFPLRYITVNKSDYADLNIISSFVFERNGESWVRWPIHPEDTHYHLHVLKWLKKHHIPYEKGRYFRAYLTASRSLFIEDPTTHHIWSFKTSTNFVGGIKQKKKMDGQQLTECRKTSDFAHLMLNHPYLHLQSFHPLLDSIGFYLQDCDLSFSLREYPELVAGTYYYLPFFAALNPRLPLHRKEGGQTLSYWMEHLFNPLAKSMAEFLVYMGLWYDSPHSQQFLVELDQEMNPTGKIIFRDLGDTYAFAPFFSSSSSFDQTFLKGWMPESLKDYFALHINLFFCVGFSVFFYDEKDFSVRDELSKDKYLKDYRRIGIHQFFIKQKKISPIQKKIMIYEKNIYDKFFDTFIKTFHQISGIEKKEWKRDRLTVKLDTSPELLSPYLERIPCFKGEEKTVTGKSCLIFQN